jgi:hypothetical protein
VVAAEEDIRRLIGRIFGQKHLVARPCPSAAIKQTIKVRPSRAPGALPARRTMRIERVRISVQRHQEPLKEVIMGIPKTALRVGGVLAIVIGLIWIGQGTGYFPYPVSSFMINQTPWVYWGAVLALLGLIAVVVSRRT